MDLFTIIDRALKVFFIIWIYFVIWDTVGFEIFG